MEGGATTRFQERAIKEFKLSRSWQADHLGRGPAEGEPAQVTAKKLDIRRPFYISSQASIPTRSVSLVSLDDLPLNTQQVQLTLES